MFVFKIFSEWEETVTIRATLSILVLFLSFFVTISYSSDPYYAIMANQWLDINDSQQSITRQRILNKKRRSGPELIQAAMGKHNSPWTHGNVYYQFAPEITSFTKDLFIRAFREWEDGTPLKFIERTNQPNYIYIIYSEITSSGVGMGGARQLLLITPYEHTPYGTVLHELGHALGLHHEHQRSDRDQYIDVFMENLTSLGQSQIGHIIPTLNYTPYDFLSVMHYGRNTLSKNTEDTIRPKAPYMLYIDRFGNRQSVSELDKEGIRKFCAYMPVLISPPDGQVDVDAGNLELCWYGFREADKFQVQVARDSNFTEIVAEQIVPAVDVHVNAIEKQYAVVDLTRNTSYYWRVRCRIENEYKSWSDPAGFSTMINDYTHYQKGQPDGLRLYQNYPNPVQSMTTIAFECSEAGPAKLTLYNSQGKEITELISNLLSPGHYEVIWDSKRVANGVYFYRLSTSRNSLTRKMVLVK
jgi:hypothetical protein